MPSQTTEQRAWRPGLKAAANPSGASDDEARTMALATLAFLLADEDRASRFLAVTGLAGAELAEHVADAMFLGGVLDFALEDEALLLAVAADAGIRPERLAVLRRRLPGALPTD